MRFAGPSQRWLLGSVGLLLAAAALSPRAEAQRRPRARRFGQTQPGGTPHVAASESGLPSRAVAGATPAAPSDPLAAFHRALALTHQGDAKTRILFFGDSHTAADCMTGRLRERLQAEYGDGGPGFLIPGKPWAHYYHSRAQVLESHGLRASFIRRRPESSSLPLGLAGLALEGGGDEPAAARLRIRGATAPSGRVLHAELSYLKRPDAATLELTYDGRPFAVLDTVGEPGPGYLAFDVPDDGPHELAFAAPTAQPVTLLGLVVELDGGGVVLDTLGVQGARARAQLYWEPNLFREQVQRRAPDLWVLAYGTNESTDATQPLDDYESHLRQVIDNLRAAAPGASCLLVGPTDFPERVKKGVYRERERNLQINRVQRALAQSAGCAFFDTIAAMGGPLSMVEWARRSPPLGARDLVHLTRAGYVILGDAIADAIMPAPPGAAHWRGAGE